MDTGFTLPVYEADRHAKKELKKRVRGIRVLERQVEGRSDPEAEVVRGYCAAVRSALTDDGRPPLEASGLKLHARLRAIEQSSSRAEKGGELPRALLRLRELIRKGLEQTRELWPDVRVAFAWVHRAAEILKNAEARSEREVRLRLRGLIGAMACHRAKAATLAPAIGHFLKVTRSYWPGLFPCYRIAGLPRTNNDLEHLSGRIATTSGAQWGARWPRRPWCCAARCGYSRPQQRACVVPARASCSHAISRSGSSSGSNSRHGSTCAAVGCVFVATPKPTWRNSKLYCYSKLCRPRKKGLREGGRVGSSQGVATPRRVTMGSPVSGSG